jgi:hypothetical protein
VGRLRLERKKDAPEHYVATVRRLGLDLGSEGPITRGRAIEARRFIQGRHSLASAQGCGDIILPGTLVAAAGPGGPGGGPGALTPTVPAAPVPPPGIGPPLVPPQEIASPVLP